MHGSMRAPHAHGFSLWLFTVVPFVVINNIIICSQSGIVCVYCYDGYSSNVIYYRIICMLMQDDF